MSYWLISIVSSIVLFAAGGFGFWLIGMLFLAEAISLGVLMGAIMAYLPAAWLLIGFAVMLLGWFPKLVILTMLLIGYTFFIGFFGDMLGLPDFLINLSPLSHVPALPVDEFSISAFLLMSVVAVFLMVIGFIGYGKRDMVG